MARVMNWDGSGRGLKKRLSRQLLGGTEVNMNQDSQCRNRESSRTSRVRVMSAAAVQTHSVPGLRENTCTCVVRESQEGIVAVI
jgi:hypothetical protein